MSSCGAEKANLEPLILELTKADSIEQVEPVQDLWSGYGAIHRYRLSGGSSRSVIVKLVTPPTEHKHPKGWHSEFAHQRKLYSYRVESHWYKNYSERCGPQCRIPKSYFVSETHDTFLIVMEDLDEKGFFVRHSEAHIEQMRPCIAWLAHFHARFMSHTPEGLWEQGTYWHLATRPDELAALEDTALKNAAHTIDRKLHDCRYKTLVHGDAKLANFCFSEDSTSVAAVDFQYVGGGCGMQDLAYFIGSCMSEQDCARYEEQLLAIYFEYLSSALEGNECGVESQDIEREWRPLFAIAWTDFHRFLKGWNPEHWKINHYSEGVARRVLRELGDGTNGKLGA